MAEFFDYDPITGITDYIEETDTPGEVRLIRVGDIEPIAEYAKKQRIDGLRDHGIKENWWHYAYIPPIVMVQMYQAGIDVTNDGKAVTQFINKHYPELKTTEKWHDDPRAKRKA